MVIVIGVWPGVIYLVAGADKLKVLLVHFALIPRGLQGLLMAFSALEFLVCRTLIGITGSVGSGGVLLRRKLTNSSSTSRT